MCDLVIVMQLHASIAHWPADDVEISAQKLTYKISDVEIWETPKWKVAAVWWVVMMGLQGLDGLAAALEKGKKWEK